MIQQDISAFTSADDAPLISLLFPVYNVAPYLEECINSVLSQEPGIALEIIMVDDCSTDNSLQIARQLCVRHPDRLQLIERARNGGIGAARNTALAVARGRYIWFLDPDDKLFAGALASLVTILDKHAPDIVICDFSKDDGPQISSFDGPANIVQHDTQALVRGTFSARKMHSWSKISKRSLWSDDFRFPEGRIFEDIASTPFLLLRARSYYYAPQNWIYYRQRRDSVMGLVSRAKGFDETGQGNLASALTGFRQEMHKHLGDVDPATNYAVAHFLARSFTQIGFKLIREKLFRMRWSDIKAMMQHYRAQTQSASPMSFEQLAQAYRAKGVVTRRIILQIFCHIAGPCPALHSSETKIPNFAIEPQVKKR